MNTNPAQIGAIVPSRLREIRTQRKLSTARLAELSGVSGIAIRSYERGIRPSIQGKQLARIAIALKTSTDYLLGISDTPRAPRNRKKKAAQPEKPRPPR